MFGSRVHPPRPLLLLLVLGVFLAIIGVTATAQSILVGAHFSTATLNDVVGSDAATTRAFVNAYLRPADLDGSAPRSSAETVALESQLGSLLRTGEIVRAEIRRPDGSLVAASDDAPGAIDAAFGGAVAGAAQASIIDAGRAGVPPERLGTSTVVRELLPISVGGQVRGVVGIWRDAVPILERLETVRREVVLLTLSAALIAGLFLLLIFRSVQRRLSRQTAALLESTRRDPLTDALNHGAIVGALAEAVETARVEGRPVGVALIDLDNLTLLNEHHGHGAGDTALLTVARLLDRAVAPPMLLGRYGPDEFLLVAPPAAIAFLETVVDQVRTDLIDESLRFNGTERLPITVSAGIAVFPEDASSATALLSVAAGVLEEAKASGGDAVRAAEPPSAEDASASATASFDVLKGLIIAVDTKDRYTKRHSEDVARYGAFLAARMGMSPDEIKTVRLAGMLHDVGKIGIPDRILRKPGKLTAGEYDVVKQHVALGDTIVRDLPDIDRIRAGIRHHHERWDGAGYLDHLEGEAIPLIARVLSVADAFSAMTTTRPYRKAFELREALDRLGDAAGSQLDEALVRAFIDGIEHDADPPLPGDEGSGLWLTGRRVA